MFYYSNVPLINKNICPKAYNHNVLATQFNYRLNLAGPACPWSIFFYAESIFTGMRNTATPGQPLGVSPPEDEWWKIYACIEHPTAETGEGNWPISPAGYPEGANVMNPLNAYIFGRVTAENKQITQMGPWSEGNLFDGLVESSRSILSNKSYWEDSFRQRGALMPNPNHNEAGYRKWLSGDYRLKEYVSHTKYIPSRYDPYYLSDSLTSAGRSADKFFPEYASQHIYMRYPPAVYGGAYKSKYAGEDKGLIYPVTGILKRKNATKDILQWALWVYTFYFRGSEAQRSLFCERRAWDAPVIDFEATKEYRGQQTWGMRSARTYGPLNICKVGFDFFKYYNRQNILAPVLGASLPKRKGTHGVAFNSIGNPRVEQYRPIFKYTIGADNAAQIDGRFLGKSRLPRGSYRTMASKDKQSRMSYENYDDVEIKVLTGYSYGKTIRFPFSDSNALSDKPDTKPNTGMVMVCSYDNGKGSVGSDHLNLSYVKNNKQGIRFGFAGYYFQTSAVENPNMNFKLRIWRHGVIAHEALITKRYSYAVNRKGIGRPAYIFNKLFYFKEPMEGGKLKFEIVPTQPDKFLDTMPEGEAKKNYSQRFKDEKNKFDKVISFGNPHATAYVPWRNSSMFSTGSGDSQIGWKDSYMLVPTATVNSMLTIPIYNSYGVQTGTENVSLETGNAIRIWNGFTGNVLEDYSDWTKAYIDGGKSFFIAIGETVGDRTKVFLSQRQDTRLSMPKKDLGTGEFYNIAGALDNGHIFIEKLELPENIFTATLEPAILLKQKPSFHDAYALLRVATEKQNERNTLARTIFTDASGVGTVGHGFSESNRVFKNYLRYGSGVNVYGSGVVPALRQKVSSNPIYESMRKFVSSYLRMADRHQLVNYTVENGVGVLYFKRYAWRGLRAKAKATILRNMEPNIDPCGRFYSPSVESSVSQNIDDLAYAKFKPILPGKQYYVYAPHGGWMNYNGYAWKNGDKFWGAPGATSLEKGTHASGDNIVFDRNLMPYVGAYEVDGITRNIPHGGTTNEWVMFMTGSHYHRSLSHVYKPSVYNDILGFLNNRCHHRSLEYERGLDPKYDMIREELLRIPLKASNVPGPRLNVLLSKSPNNFNYIFNTNNPDTGDLHIYGIRNFVAAYRKSCPPATDRPYYVTSCKLVSSLGRTLSSHHLNPSAMKISGVPRPAQIVRVELDRRLKGTGKLNIGPSGWASVTPAVASEEPYRTDENAIIEYLMSENLGRAGYNCKRQMLGDYGVKTNIHTSSGRPFGACYPRFYFLKLIPLVGADSLLDVEPYAQMDFYMRAMAGQFVMPYNYYNAPGQVHSINWKYTELSSRSAEEDPASYYYVDPREIQS